MKDDNWYLLEGLIRTAVPSVRFGLWPSKSLFGAGVWPPAESRTLLLAPELPERDRKGPPARLQNVITVVESDPAGPTSLAPGVRRR